MDVQRRKLTPSVVRLINDTIKKECLIRCSQRNITLIMKILKLHPSYEFHVTLAIKRILRMHRLHAMKIFEDLISPIDANNILMLRTNATKLYTYFNSIVFKNRLPEENVLIEFGAYEGTVAGETLWYSISKRATIKVPWFA